MASYPRSTHNAIEFSIVPEPCEIDENNKFLELGTRVIAALSTISLMVNIFLDVTFKKKEKPHLFTGNGPSSF